MLERGMFNFEQGRKTRVYDPNEKDATKKLIAEFPTIKNCAIALGLTTNIVSRAIKDKKRRFSPSLNKEVAIR